MERGKVGSEGSRCVLCGGALVLVLDDVLDTRFGVPGRFSIRRCRSCGLEQTLPRPSLPDLIQLYEAHYNFGEVTGGAYRGLRRLLYSPSLYRLWLAIDGDISFHARRGSGRLLDIGCNEGRGLPMYVLGGFEVEGLEPNRRAAAAAAASGFVVHAVDLLDFEAERPYDVAVLSNVLEHFLEPKAALRAVHRLLRPGGEVWISCPNNASWLRHFAGPAWINWHVPFHIVHFSRTTLRRALEETGFEIVEQRQITPALWVAQTLLAYVFARPGETTRALRNPVLVALLMGIARFQLFLLLWLGNRRGVGDCLLTVARKVAPSCES